MPKPKQATKQTNVKPKRPRKHKPKRKTTSKLSLSNIGSSLGAMAGRAISRITGVGDYKVSSNTVLHGQCPSFSSSANGMRITHREFITDCVASVNFSNLSFYINPGNSYLFPWLSSIANSFETYTIHGLVVGYTSTSGNVVNDTGAMGTVIASTEYDVLKPIFTSKATAEAYEFTTSCGPNVNMLHPIECKTSLTPLPQKYITNRVIPRDLSSDDDPRLHYHGLLQLMSVGQQSSGPSIGEWHISYDISLYTPRLPQATIGNSDVVMQRIINGTGTPGVTWPTHAFSNNNPENIEYTWVVNPGSLYTVLGTCRVPGYYEFNINSSNIYGDNLEFTTGWFTQGCTPQPAFPTISQDTFTSFPVTTSFSTVLGATSAVMTNQNRLRVLMVPGNVVYFPSVKKVQNDSNGVVEYRSTKLGSSVEIYTPPPASLDIYSTDAEDFLQIDQQVEQTPDIAEEKLASAIQITKTNTHPQNAKLSIKK